MTDYSVIEIIDPEPLAMVRSFHCQICDKQHLHKGKIYRVWVGDAGGYLSNAAEECYLKVKEVDDDLAAICQMIAGAVPA